MITSPDTDSIVSAVGEKSLLRLWLRPGAHRNYNFGFFQIAKTRHSIVIISWIINIASTSEPHKTQQILYCHGPANSINGSRMSCIKLLDIFSIMSKRQLRRYEQDTPVAFRHFRSRRNSWFFHWVGNTPSAMHDLNWLMNYFGLVLVTNLKFLENPPYIWMGWRTKALFGIKSFKRACIINWKNVCIVLHCWVQYVEIHTKWKAFKISNIFRFYLRKIAAELYRLLIVSKLHCKIRYFKSGDFDAAEKERGKPSAYERSGGFRRSADGYHISWTRRRWKGANTPVKCNLHNTKEN